MRTLSKTFMHAVLIACLCTSTVQAETTLSLTFLQPSGTSSSTDTIDVWVRLTVSGDEPFAFDDSVSEPPLGITPSLLPLYGNDYVNGNYNVPFASYTSLYRSVVRYCNDSFTVGCGAGEFKFELSATQNWGNATNLGAYTLGPGESADFLLYQLVPTDGSAAPGVYTLRNVGLGIGVMGLDEAGNVLQGSLHTLTCTGNDPDCGFTRTVMSAVPEPSSWAMLLGGVALVGSRIWRRPRTQLDFAATTG